jgi:Pyridoxamine 5'-phosphate oxidase
MVNEKVEFDFTEIFKDERIGFLSTIHKDSGAIQQNAISWIHGYKPNVLRIAVGSKAQIVTNIESNENVNFAFFYRKSIFSFQSKGKIVTKSIPGVPFPLTLIELETDELHDIMFYGAEITQEPVYEKTYNIKAAKKLDEQVYEGMALEFEGVTS